LGVTIYDIAASARVSIATVSRVFNDRPRVSRVTREKVLRIASELGYQPHMHARSLARRKTSLVTAVIPRMTTYFFLEVMRGLQDGLGSNGYDLVVFAARTMDGVDGQVRRALQRKMSAGMCVFSSRLSEEQADELLASGQPTVFVDSRHSAFDSVWIDNRLGGRLAAEHLLSAGCERLALIMANPASVPASERRSGFLDALKKHGRKAIGELMVACGTSSDHGYSESEGHRAMEQMLSGAVHPDGVFATSDAQALGVLTALRTADLRVPADVAVVGFDDLPMSRHVELTTLRQPMYEMGYEASEMLVARMADTGVPIARKVFLPELRIRGTTAVGRHGRILASREEVPSVI
jgi:LacI family transcriptional regulator